MRYVTMAAARLVCANLIPYSHLSKLKTLSPPGSAWRWPTYSF